MIEIQDFNDYTLIKISNSQANLQNAELFRAEVLKVIDSGKKNLIIDFSNVAYVDSTFLSVLVAILKAAMKENGDVAVFGLNEDIAHLFSIIRLDKAFKIYNRLPENFSDTKS